MKPILYLGCTARERAETEKSLAAASLAVVWADDEAHALSELQQRDMPVLLDLGRGANALQVARGIRNHRSGALLFAVVDDRRPDLTTEAVLAGVADVFARPLGGRRVASAIEREQAYETRHPGRIIEVNSDNLYAHSSAMREVAALIARAATTRAGVVIRGEEGTGRRVVARAIHVAQAEPAGTFVCVDCAASDADHLDAELFGAAARGGKGDLSERGLEGVSRNSRLHEARCGTLYLRNLGDTPARVQARLAHVLRDREAVLVETGAVTSLDVRPMVGVDPGFDLAVAEGRVREDLLKRLSVIRIDMPPLRSRREDIPALANCLLREVCASRGLAPTAISRPALSLLSALPWRGNATELRALIEHAVAELSEGGGIRLEDVLAHVRLDGGTMVSGRRGTLREARARFEREYIAEVLALHRGRIGEAARTLGIQRTNLYRKMRSLRVARDRRQQEN